MRRAWPLLPPALQGTGARLARGRTALMLLALFIPISIASEIAHDTPEQFARYLTSLTPLGALALVVAGIAVIAIRAERTAPEFIEAYAQLLPDRAEEIRIAFGERGVGDVVAPWIRTQRSLMAMVAKRIGARLGMTP